MKYAIKYLILIVVGGLLLGSCSKKTIIPDDELKNIAREMFLVNAYVSSNRINTDSLDIYTPILERYGYTQDDFFNTLANYQKRKSARLGDVMNATILDMESLSEGYQAKLRNKRFIDSLAKAGCKKEIFTLDGVEVNRMKDTARLRISLPIIDKGEYVVEYSYNIDTLDKNLRLQSEHTTYDRNGKRLSLMRNNLSGGGTTKHYSTTITPRPSAERYELLLADYTRREDEPHISFSSLRITYFPPIEEALEQMSYELRIKPMFFLDESMRFRGHYINTPIPTLPTDTLWMPLDSIDLAQAALLYREADSLGKKAEKLNKELEKLNDKKTTKEVTRKREELTGEIEALERDALQRNQRADSLEIGIFGYARERD